MTSGSLNNVRPAPLGNVRRIRGHDSRGVDKRSAATVGGNTPGRLSRNSSSSNVHPRSCASDMGLRDDMDAILKRHKEWVYWRWPRPDHPTFRSAPKAAQLLLDAIGPEARILCMRDRCLRPVRELALERGNALMVPSRDGNMVYTLPQSAIYSRGGQRRPLHIEPLPEGSRRYNGQVDVVVVGCLAWNRFEARLYSYDTERTASILIGLYEGLRNGFRLAPSVPVLCVAADCQEVAGWPDSALGYVEATGVVTPTRIVALGDGALLYPQYIGLGS